MPEACITTTSTKVLMSANKWDQINYEHVASICMNNNKEHFEAHDKERFEQFLADVGSGKKRIAAGALKPHELVREAFAAARQVGGAAVLVHVGVLCWLLVSVVTCLFMSVMVSTRSTWRHAMKRASSRC